MTKYKRRWVLEHLSSSSRWVFNSYSAARTSVEASALHLLGRDEQLSSRVCCEMHPPPLDSVVRHRSLEWYTSSGETVLRLSEATEDADRMCRGLGPQVIPREFLVPPSA